MCAKRALSGSDNSRPWYEDAGIPTKPARRPQAYTDGPEVEIGPSLADGYEIRKTPDRIRVRHSLSKAGERKHERLEALGVCGWRIVSMKGAGMVVHPDREGFFSIAAAAHEEGL